MSYGGPGMWMPKQKMGKNWKVDYTITMDGKKYEVSRKFRIRQSALEFIARSKMNLDRDERVVDYKFNKPEKL